MPIKLKLSQLPKPIRALLFAKVMALTSGVQTVMGAPIANDTLNPDTMVQSDIELSAILSELEILGIAKRDAQTKSIQVFKPNDLVEYFGADLVASYYSGSGCVFTK